MSRVLSVFFFFFNDTATTEIYTLSLHDALPIFQHVGGSGAGDRRTCLGDLCTAAIRGRRHPRGGRRRAAAGRLHHGGRSEEHTSELQSQSNLVCRLLLEKKKKKTLMSQRALCEC